jgi:hypothetical protein
VFKNNFSAIYTNFSGFIGTLAPVPCIYKTGAHYKFEGMGSSTGGNETIVMGFPGDTISLTSFGLSSSEELISCDGFCYSYTVSETQIDENSTSYSMVSLDEGASSSGGAITEGSSEEIVDFNYMLSAITPWEMEFNTAVEHCRDLTYDGYTDWRLPSIDELTDALSGGAENSILSDNQVWTRTFDPSMGSQYNGYLRLNLNNFTYSESDSWSNHTAYTICIRGR